MIIKAIPYLLIILPLIGFFVSPLSFTNGHLPTNGIQRFFLIVFTLPWWGKIISILVGLIWILGSNGNNNESDANASPIKPKDGAGIR